jgi:hypothetical protein
MGRNGINYLIVYTEIDILNTVIEFLRDEHGTQPTLTLIRQLIKDAATSSDAYQLLQFVERGLEFVEYHGLPAIFNTYFTTQREDGRPYTITIAKSLKYHPPLMEFRVNWEEPDAGAFRAVFFEYQYKQYQILVFTHAVIKQQTNSAAFNAAVAATEALLPDFYRQPEKYINLQGVEEK